MNTRRGCENRELNILFCSRDLTAPGFVFVLFSAPFQYLFQCLCFFNTFIPAPLSFQYLCFFSTFAVSVSFFQHLCFFISGIVLL